MPDPDRYHFTLALGHALWDELLRGALPISVADGEFHVARDVRNGIKQLGMRQRVKGLLEDRNPPAMLQRATSRARSLWRDRKPGVYRRLNDIVRVQGKWKVELDDRGTGFQYGTQKVGADAWVKGSVEGTIYLLRENVEIPFTLEKRLGASVTLGDVRYDKGHEAVIGSLQDLGVHIGDNVVFELLARLGERLLEQQLGTVNPIPILRREQVEEMVGPMAQPLGMHMGVEDLRLDLSEHDLTLRIRFGFAHAQIEDQSGE